MMMVLNQFGVKSLGVANRKQSSKSQIRQMIHSAFVHLDEGQQVVNETGDCQSMPLQAFKTNTIVPISEDA